MDNRGWSRAYWAVALLALLLVPSGAYVAATTAGTTAHVTSDFEAELPSTTELFINVGRAGYALIAGACLLIIGSMALRRHEPVAVVVSMALFAGCLGLFLLAALSSYYPFFWNIDYRLR